MYQFQGYQLVTWDWTAVAFSAIFISTRLYANFTGLRKVAIYRDVLVVVALVLYITDTSLTSVANGLDNFKDVPGRPPYQDDRQIALFKMSYAGVFVSFTMYALIKMDLLFLYHDLAPRASHPKLFWLIMVGWFFVVGGYITTFVDYWINCIPFSTNWTLDNNKWWQDCQPPDYNTYLYWTPHIASEVAVFTIPLIIISRLQNWTLSQKFSAGWMFLVGLINMLTIIANFAISMYLRTHDTPALHALVGIYTFTMFQMGIFRITAFLIICMPQIKSVYQLVRRKISERRAASANRDDLDDVEAKADEDPAAAKVGKDIPVNINVSTLHMGSVGVATTDVPERTESKDS